MSVLRTLGTSRSLLQKDVRTRAVSCLSQMTATRSISLSSSQKNIATSKLLACDTQPREPRGDYQWLQTLVRKNPLVLDVPHHHEAEVDQYFQLPLGTHFRAPSSEMGIAMGEAVGHALRKHGLAVIDLGFEDPRSNFLLEIINSMGCSADTHSSTQGALWDVTYKPDGVFNSKSGGTAHSRSHGVGEFAWHTDGSFEEHPQRYFGLHIVHPDEMGGGVFRIFPAESLVETLSPSSVQTLLETEFDIQVPDEFFKGQASNRGKILQRDPVTGHYLLRFRRDILPDPPSESHAACQAIDELNQLLDDPNTKGWRFGSNLFKKNVIILMDNARFLHMRTEIKDKRRLLRRVRFHDRPLI